MAEVFAHAVEATRSLPRQAFVELTFDPGVGGGHVAVGITGGPLETIPGDPRDGVPPRTRQDASVRVEVFPPKATTPRVTKTHSLFRPTGELAVVVGFDVPASARGRWTCRIHNTGVSPVTCHAKVLYTALSRQILSTPIPIRVLNHALHQLLDAIGLRVHLDGANSVIGPSKELQSVADVPDVPVDLPGEIHDVNLETLRVEALRRGLGVDTPRVRIYVDFETLGPAEIQALGLDVVDVTAASVQVDFSLTTEGTIGRRRIVPSNFTVTADVRAELTDGVRWRMVALGALLAGGIGALAGLIGAEKVDDAIDDLIEALPAEIERFLERSPYRRVVGDFLTDGFRQLVHRDHVFHDLRHSGGNWVVDHYDPAVVVAPPSAPPTPAPPTTPPTKPPPTPPVPPSGPRPGPGSGEDQRPPGGHIPFAPDGGPRVVVTAEAAPAPTPTPAAAGGNGSAEALARLRGIDTIVVLMQENRSFDHMLGHLRVGKPGSKVEGLTGDEANSTAGNIRVTARPLSGPDFGFSPAHDFDEVTRQIADGAMSGFLTSFRERWGQAPLDGPRQRTPLSYYTSQQLDVTTFLARNYTVCNRWFCSFPGGTQPNRFCTLSGFTPVTENFGLDDDDIGFVRLPTLFDQLDEARVEWSYFEHDVAFLRFYDRHRLDGRRVVPIGQPGDTSGDGFYARARNGTLPPVSFIDPNFVDIPPLRAANDDHAPADVRNGQALIAAIHDALVQQPGDRFARTLFVITYDEHGGFYDHVAPPGTSRFQPPRPPLENAPAARAGSGPGGSAPAVAAPPARRTIDRVHPEATTYGVRVPTLLVSPRVAANAATNVEFDHTSIAKTILLRFVGPGYRPLGPRMAGAHHIGEVLQARARPDRKLARPPQPTPVPDEPTGPPGSQPRSAPRAGSRGDDGDTFHEIIRRFGRPIR